MTITNDKDFSLEGIRFKVITDGDYHARQTDEDGVVLLKDWLFVQAELKAIEGIDVRRMMELGLWQGGSAALWPLVLPLERYIGIDLASLDMPFPDEVTQHPRWGVTRLHGNTSQDDRAALHRILDTDLDGPLDLVLDDASHHYELSRASFEILFPRIRAGGVYILEDWPWAHRPGVWQEANHDWAPYPALSNLVMDFVELAASQFEMVPRIEVTPYYVAVHKGWAEVGDDFRLDAAIRRRGRARELI